MAVSPAEYQEIEKASTTWLIVNVVSAAVCGCMPLGIIGAILAHQAKEKARMGDLVAARDKLGWAKGLGIGGISIGVVGVLLVIVINIAAVAM